MNLHRTCRNPECGKVSKNVKPERKACPKCRTPYGPLVFGLDHDDDVPTGLTAAEKGAEWSATLARFRRENAGETR